MPHIVNTGSIAFDGPVRKTKDDYKPVAGKDRVKAKAKAKAKAKIDS